jgi:hypothetical protein
MDKKEPHKSFNLDKDDTDNLVDGLNGFDWARSDKGWGSKWGICSPTLTTDDDNCLVYLFDSAWSPCIPVVAKMNEMFPKLKFNYSYEESGCDFMGEQIYNKGKLIHEEESNFIYTCEECEVRDESVEYIEDKEMYLCKRCKLNDLQKAVYDKVNGVQK